MGTGEKEYFVEPVPAMDPFLTEARTNPEPRLKRSSRNFNLWQKERGLYRPAACLFYEDPVCGTQWTVYNLDEVQVYDEEEIQDELENPLNPIPVERVEGLLKLTDPDQVVKVFEEWA